MPGGRQKEVMGFELGRGGACVGPRGSLGGEEARREGGQFWGLKGAENGLGEGWCMGSQRTGRGLMGSADVSGGFAGAREGAWGRGPEGNRP